MYSCQIEERTTEERDRLILEHLPQVRLIARRIHERLPDNVSIDDLISTGTIGLISAIDNFDPGQNVKLKTYAEYRIRGSILDGLRGLDWAPREKRKMSRRIQAAIATAEQRLGRVPGEEEIAAELGLKVDEYHQWLVEIEGLQMGDLEQAPSDEEGYNLLQFVQGDDSNLPSRILEKSELERLVAEAIEKMPKIERTVLSLYYREELNLREIAGIMELHLSRISQLKSQAILRLRCSIEKRWPGRR
ncbi:MAG: FliA/WhiG family RNA polymerase sigma factor [Acidobacteriota bacterium]|nr:FliA/WhiG family RNA polymerase sigma factor [Acidobacteriota bacterium]